MAFRRPAVRSRSAPLDLRVFAGDRWATRVLRLLKDDTADKDKADKAKGKPDVGLGICVGVATRCDLPPKGIC